MLPFLYTFHPDFPNINILHNQSTVTKAEK